MHSPIKPFVKRFRGEIIISTLSALFGLITSLIVQIYFSSGNLYLTGFYTFGVTIISLLVAMMFNQKRIFEIGRAHV